MISDMKVMMDNHVLQNHNVPSIIPPEYKINANGSTYADGSVQYSHPVSGTTDRFILGDRFHSSSNPHKSSLCSYHDINLCDQANCVSTSIQESQNNRKNIRRLRSTCHQNFETHVLFNFLLDFYQNEQIVKEQERIICKDIRSDQKLLRDDMLRFVIR